jgi:hypothetical protein
MKTEEINYKVLSLWEIIIPCNRANTFSGDINNLPGLKYVLKAKEIK